MSISLTPSNYYSLSGSQSGSTGTASTPTSLTQSLVAALDSVDNGSSGNGGSNAYSLNLSPAAQQLLNGGSTGTGVSNSSNFTLTTAQQATISSILAKYKDSPFTQATFDSIQSDLEAAGLGADQLSAKDEISSFNPTSSLISALNGNFSSMSGASTALNTEQTKTTNYMQSIISQWQSISGTNSSDN